MESRNLKKLLFNKMKNLGRVTTKILKKVSILLFGCLIMAMDNGHAYHGEFKVLKTVTVIDSSLHYTKFSGMCNLYSDAVMTTQSWLASDLGRVYFNDVELQYNNGIRTYLDKLDRNECQSIVWTLNDSPIISNFTVVCSEAFPSVSSYNFIPDKLNRAVGFEIVVHGIKNADEIQIFLNDGQFRLSAPFYRLVPVQQNQVFIPSSDLSSLSGDHVTVSVTIISKEMKVVNGKVFKFQKILNIIRTITLL